MSLRNGRAVVVVRVGATLPSHPRMLRIQKGDVRGAALGAWLAATGYSRLEELDGWCPAEALEGVASKATLERLVEVGLFDPRERDGVPGFDVVKYAEFNELKA